MQAGVSLTRIWRWSTSLAARVLSKYLLQATGILGASIKAQNGSILH